MIPRDRTESQSGAADRNQDSAIASRPKVHVGTTVYDAFPSLADLHAVKKEHYPDINDPYFWEVFEKCKPYTCLSVERFFNIYQAIEYIARAKISGDIVECGVFLGGSIVGAAMFAEYFGLPGRRMFLFDTFEGFPLNTVEKDVFGSNMDLSTLSVFNNSFRHVVEKNVRESGIDPERFVLIQGQVEHTLRRAIPVSEMSYLRLDTDYYESTKLELEILYPRLAEGGVLIIDDYGHFEGARLAVDEYCSTLKRPPLLQRIDYTGRCGIKI